MVEELTAYVTWLNQQGVSSRGEGRKTSLAALVSCKGIHGAQCALNLCRASISDMFHRTKGSSCRFAM